MRIYLAAPYAHPNPAVRLFRLKAVNGMAAKLLKEGHEVFSPLSMGHEICRTCELPTDFPFWRSTCLSMIEHWATHVYVLNLEGWEESVGVREEMALTKKLGIECNMLDYSEVQQETCATCHSNKSFLKRINSETLSNLMAFIFHKLFIIGAILSIPLFLYAIFLVLKHVVRPLFGTLVKTLY